MPSPTKIIAFLRGINIGGHHKIPMALLRIELASIGASNVKTLLNSGNVVFETSEDNLEELQDKIEKHLTRSFGFQVPVLLREASKVKELVESNPFKTIGERKDIMCYITFLKKQPELIPTLPIVSKDKSFTIIDINDRAVFSILDGSIIKTPKGMEELEKLFGKDITTRNWNTVLKITEL